MRLTAAVLGAALGCGAPSVVQPAIDQPFSLQLGQTAEFADQQLTITFRSVQAESRCPRTVQCVWEGNAEVELVATIEHGAQIIVLNTSLEPRAAAIGGYRLVLRSLTPDPPLVPDQYRLMLELRTD